MQQEGQGKEKGGAKKAKGADKKSGKATKEDAVPKKGKKGGKPAQPRSDEEDEDSTFELSEEEDGGAGKGKGKSGKGGGGGGGGGMFDPVSSKLKNQDLRTAMMDWGSSSSDDEEEEGEEEGGEGGGEALDLEGLKLPVSDYVAAGEETRRLAIVDMDWSRVKAVSPSMALYALVVCVGWPLPIAYAVVVHAS